MQKYFLVFKLAIQDIFTYRFNFFMHAFKYALFIFLMAMVWLAVNQENPLPNFNASQIIQYYVFAAILYGLSNFHPVYIDEDIRLGQLTRFILKPLSPFWFYYTFQLATTALEALLKAIMMFLVLMVLNMPITIQPSHVLLFLLFLPVIYTFSFTSFFAVSALAFWLHDVFSIRLTIMFIFRMLSGVMIPLMFFPTPVQKILELTPMMHLAFTPIRILQQQISISDGLQYLGILSIWTIVMYIVGITVWRKGTHSFEGNGI